MSYSTSYCRTTRIGRRNNHTLHFFMYFSKDELIVSSAVKALLYCFLLVKRSCKKKLKKLKRIYYIGLFRNPFTAEGFQKTPLGSYPRELSTKGEPGSVNESFPPTHTLHSERPPGCVSQTQTILHCCIKSPEGDV